MTEAMPLSEKIKLDEYSSLSWYDFCSSDSSYLCDVLKSVPMPEGRVGQEAWGKAAYIWLRWNEITAIRGQDVQGGFSWKVSRPGLPDIKHGEMARPTFDVPPTPHDPDIFPLLRDFCRQDLRWMALNAQAPVPIFYLHAEDNEAIHRDSYYEPVDMGVMMELLLEKCSLRYNKRDATLDLMHTFLMSSKAESKDPILVCPAQAFCAPGPVTLSARVLQKETQAASYTPSRLRL